MSTPFQIPKPVRPANGTTVPPKPATPPATGPVKPNVNKTRNFGGINLNPALNVTVVGTNNTGPQAAPASGQQTGPSAAPGNGGTPGADFGSNEDIRAFCEHLRKNARNRAVERSMDAEHLEAVLRHIPTADGMMAGSWLRARRVSRHLKKIASAEQLIAKESAAAYAQFEREYEAELRKVGRARPQQRPRTAFSFN